jgi:hypothetical protein
MVGISNKIYAMVGMTFRMGLNIMLYFFKI